MHDLWLVIMKLSDYCKLLYSPKLVIGLYTFSIKTLIEWIHKSVHVQSTSLYLCQPKMETNQTQPQLQMLQSSVTGTTILAILQVFINFIPSIIINSLILASYHHCKKLRTPYNLLFVVFSILSIASDAVLFIFSSIVRPITATSGTGACVFTFIEIKVQNLLVFSLPPLLIALMACIQCYVIVKGAKKLTHKKITLAIAIMWSYGLIIWTVSTVAFVYNLNKSNCEPDNGLNKTMRETQHTHRHRTIGRISHTVIDMTFVVVPSFFMILVSTIISCSCFYKKSLNPSSSLQRKMLLLPILMISFSFTTELLSRILITTTSLLDLKVVTTTTLRLISQSNSILYGGLFIGLHKEFRMGIRTTLRDMKISVMKLFFKSKERKNLSSESMN